MAALSAAIATGIGSETQKPLARVVVGGMITSSVLILLVLPAMYLLVHRSALYRQVSAATDSLQTEIPGD